MALLWEPPSTFATFALPPCCGLPNNRACNGPMRFWTGGLWMSQTKFIAETDERGAVLCVWRYAPGDRSARPLDGPSGYMRELSQASVHGASPTAVADWLKA